MSTSVGRRSHSEPPRHEQRASRGILPAGRRERQWRSRVGDALELAVLASLVLVVAVFLRNGGSHALLSGPWTDRLIGVGRVTGLVSVDLLLLQLLLAARLPWVDRAYGTDRALRAHRILGRVTIPLVLVHVESLVLGYAGQDGLSAWTGWAIEPFRMVSDVPDMLTATAATVLLVVIAVTSVRAAMRAVGYERWHVVHLSAYAAVTLAIPHQLSIGSDLTASPLVHAYWLALYTGVAGAIVWWRFLVPVVRSLRHQLRVEAVVSDGPGTWSVWVSGRALGALDARAGQFFNWRFVTPGLWLFAHPWSLSTQPNGRHLRLTVRDLGDHSRSVASLRPGTRVVIEGPYGAFTTRRRTRRKVLLLAAGIGITPIRALAEELANDPATRRGDVTVIYRGDTPAQMSLAGELQSLARHGGQHLHLLTGPPVRGSWFPGDGGDRVGDDAARLTRIVGDVRRQDVYVCGPPVWMDLVHTSLKAAKVPGDQIHDERFTW